MICKVTLLLVLIQLALSSVDANVLRFTKEAPVVKHPVILVPGDGGSQLVAKLNKTTAPHSWCEKKTKDYENIWLNLDAFFPWVLSCFVDDMRLVYDPVKHVSNNSPGVDIRTKGFGDTLTVEFLDPSSTSHLLQTIQYFYPLVHALVKNAGYERNISVRGAPFDFRKAPNEMGEYFGKLKGLVEETYNINNRTKVVLVGHSMGNPVTLYFLNHQPQAWKDKYIQSWITLAGVWGGAVKTLRLMTSGDNLGIDFISPLALRPEQRSMPSTAFLMPSDKFWKPDEVLVQTVDKNYTVKDYGALFNDMDYMTGYKLWQDTHKLIYDLTPPGVPVHCLHGSSLPTPASFIFPTEDDFPDIYPKVVSKNGDGTVNMRSLLGCLQWRGKQRDPVEHVVIPKAEHMGILSLPETIKYLFSVAMPNQNYDISHFDVL